MVLVDYHRSISLLKSKSDSLTHKKAVLNTIIKPKRLYSSDDINILNDLIGTVEASFPTIAVFRKKKGLLGKEKELWELSNIKIPFKENWYLSVGQGMGSTLLIANQKNAYTLSDRSTWIAFNKKENLQIVCENLPPLFNQYGIILVSNKINNNLNIEEAKKYIDLFSWKAILILH